MVQESAKASSQFARAHLPIDDVERQVLDLILQNDTSIIIGETGCGKSTQIPQICLRCPLKGRIAVTQPRRVAAVSLAARVASERSRGLGEEIGYHVRFENVVSAETAVVYMTDGILLREAIHDGLLLDYSIIIVDEAHERSLHTDVLLSILRLAQLQRKAKDPLKIVVMSATMHADLFSKYFNDAPIYLIKGRTFPVEMLYADALDSDESDYVYNTIVTIVQIHRQEPITDDILVFLTGQEEIELTCKKLRNINKELEDEMYVLPLYAALKPASQQKVFLPAPHGKRKVIVSTNIAETSLTIPGVRIVVDCGKMKQKTFCASSRTETLRVELISKAQANQRAGRAGRESSGKCFRLYSRKHFNSLPDSPIPQILRSNLASVFLELISIGMKKVNSLKLIEQPSEELRLAAVNQLLALGAVERAKKDKLILTDQGRIMAKFPVEPQYAKVLLAAASLGCLEESLTIVAAACGESVICMSSGEKETCLSARLHSLEGDHLSMLNVFRLYCKEKKRLDKKQLLEWSAEMGLNPRALASVHKIRKQLREVASDASLRMTSAGADREKIRRSLAMGLFMNACELDRERDCYRLLCSPSTLLRIHPSSALARSRPSAFVFSQLLRTNHLYAKDITVIDRAWVEDAVSDYRRKH